MSGPFLAGVVAGYGVAIPVGAIGVLIAGLSARTSLTVGAAAGLGAATADGIYAAAAVLGGAALASAVAPVATPLRWLSAATLLVLAGWTVRAALTPPRPAAEMSRLDRAGPGTAYLAVLGLTVLNPATVVYFTALVLGRGGSGGGAWFVAGAFVASASWQLLIAGTGAAAGRFLTTPRARRVTALVSGALIAVLAVGLVL
ncbi:LysE family transporter [Actinoplanes sp. RD1]|uniref:LysE family transporter n=1 Tax=Actinoplanes sp. RD1 TaxID=3064538 RepID=UPI002740A09F|nr:LysE family transporter [Actinoplanes sp. RD1]